MPRGIILCILLCLAGCASTQQSLPEKELTAKKPTDLPRRIVSASAPIQPDWLDCPDTFTREDAPGFRYFRGRALEQHDLQRTITQAKADALETAGGYMGTQVEGRFQQVIEERLGNADATYHEIVRAETRTTVSGLIEQVEWVADPYRIFYNNKTYDVHVLLRVPEARLDPIAALVRGLRREAARAGQPQEIIRQMNGILALQLHDKHALYLKARALADLGRNAQAYEAYKTLKEWNQGVPMLNLGSLYNEAELPVPAGSLQAEDLDEILFRLTPHWENLMHRLHTMAKNRSNTALFEMKLNQTTFFRSNHGDGAEPLHITLKCPDRQPRWMAFFWIDDDGLCQANPSAPAPDPIKEAKTWVFPLDCPNGEVRLLALASSDKESVDFSDLDTAFAEKMIPKDNVVTLSDPEEVDRLERLIQAMEQQANHDSGLTTALVRFVVSP